MSDPNEYTIGWICAIQPELVAARVFLDEEYPMLALQEPNDNNLYQLGRIGQHKVAIACLPMGNYGTVSAANVASDMLRTFKHVRFGLLVGIGGGVPSEKNDIRLGDVVVSAVSHEMGAVFQYDFGVAMQNQALLQTTAHHDAPPILLQSAVQSLQAEHIIKGNCLEESIDCVLSKHPRLKRAFSCPDRDTDRLYRSDFVHQGEPGQSCASVCGLDAASLVTRDPRDEFDDNPKVHYGLIASANQLMKDANVRDRLAGRGVLCFEMEAAGLTETFKCLVIRGICDYADSHKAKGWQGYAAMAAAAYAKDLLRLIPPTRIQAESKMGGQVSMG